MALLLLYLHMLWDNLSLLFPQVSNAAREPTSILEELWALLVREQPDWLSKKVE